VDSRCAAPRSGVRARTLLHALLLAEPLGACGWRRKRARQRWAAAPPCVRWRRRLKTEAAHVIDLIGCMECTTNMLKSPKRR
jgi:hypothetical protein